MKIRLFKVKLIQFDLYFYPFSFVSKLKIKIKNAYEFYKIKKEIKSLDWNWNDVLEITRYCTSLNDAVSTLVYKFTEDRLLKKKVGKLILGGFDRDWK